MMYNHSVLFIEGQHNGWVYRMRHIFIINPKAGKNAAALKIADEINSYFAKHSGDYALRMTEYEGHAIEIAKEECEKGDSVRIYACGGDGTLMEAISGAYGYDNAEVTAIPCGSGNDYVRTYGTREDFLNIADLIEGEAITVDAIKCKDKLSLNICAMGMDADVADKMTRFKNLPFVSGSMAYKLAIVNVFFHRFGRDLKIEIETPNGVVKRSGRYMFVVIANGQYYGGGYRSAPNAVTDDGILDFVLISFIHRYQIPKFLSNYKRGEHLTDKRCELISGTSIKITSKTPAVVTADGQCFSDTEINCNILKNAYRFVLPAKLIAKRNKNDTKTAIAN